MFKKHTSARRSSHGSSSKSSHHKESRAVEVPEIPATLLFTVNELEINDDPSEGGVLPRTDEHGYWVPPIRAAGFTRSDSKDLYRWKDGVIDRMEQDPERIRSRLTLYKTWTVVYCNQWLQFQAARIDASAYDIEDAPWPSNRWYLLSFQHSEGISSLDVSGTQQFLAGRGRNWITQLGLNSYCNDLDTSEAQGLTGDLGILIALIAFSCRAKDLDQILSDDRAWHRHSWRGHDRRHGRTAQRAMVVNIYLDPNNPQYSTLDELARLETSWMTFLR